MFLSGRHRPRHIVCSPRARLTRPHTGGDQGLLNRFFREWSTGDSSKRLPFIYNVNVSAHYSYAPAYQEYRDNIRIIHFIGPGKPWQWYAGLVIAK